MMTRGWPAFSKTAALHCLGIEVDMLLRVVGLIRVSINDAKQKYDQQAFWENVHTVDQLYIFGKSYQLGLGRFL